MSLDVAILNYAAFRNVFQPLCNPCLSPFKIRNSLIRPESLITLEHTVTCAADSVQIET